MAELGMSRQSDMTEDISLGELWKIILDGKWIVVLITVVITGLVAVLAMIATPIYHAEVLLAAREGEDIGANLGQLGNLASLAGVRLNGGGDQKIQAVAMLRSRGLAEQFIRENGLVKIFFDDLWDAESETWLVDDPADIPSMRDAVRKFIENVRSVDEDAGTGLVTLGIEWQDPTVVAQWANDFVRLLNSEMRQQAIAEAEESIAYLREEANKTSVVELERVIYSLVQEQIQTIMLANVREDYAFEILDPAVVPELDEQVWPKRTLMVAVGFMLGSILGLFGAFIWHGRRSSGEGRSRTG